MRFRSRCLWFVLLISPILLGVWMRRAASWRPKIARVSKSAVLALHWSSDGRTLKCATGDGHIQTLSSSSLEILSSTGQPAHWLSAQFSDNGLLLAGSLDEVRLLGCASGRTIWTRSFVQDNTLMYSPQIASIALSPHGNELAFGVSQGNHGYSCAFKIHDGHVVPDVSESSGRFWGGETQTIAFSTQGALGWNTEEEGFIVQDEKRNKELWSIKSKNIFSSSFSPDARFLAVTESNDLLEVLDARTGRSFQSLGSPAVGYTLAWSPDSRVLADVGGSADVCVLRVGQSGWWRRYPTKARGVRSLAFSPDSSRLAVGTPDGHVQLWRVK